MIIKVRDVLVLLTSHLFKVTRINNRNEGLMLDKTKDKNKPIDTGIIIIILTAASYALAYAYQVTYMRFYHLPHTFVEMNLTNMIVPLSVTFCLLFFFCLLIYIIVRLFSVKFSDLGFSFYFIFAGILGAAFTIGLLHAKVAGNAREEYMVITEKEHLFVVITSYKDSIIIAPLDLEKESITPKFKAIETKELKDAETIHFENGLKVEDVRNSKDLID